MRNINFSTDDSRFARRRVPAALSTACSSQWLSAHPLLWVPRQPPPCRKSSPLSGTATYAGAPTATAAETIGSAASYSQDTMCCCVRSVRRGIWCGSAFSPPALPPQPGIAHEPASSSIRREASVSPAFRASLSSSASNTISTSLCSSESIIS